MSDFAELLEASRAVDFVRTDAGYIVWRFGTGANIELLHLRVEPNARRCGQGTALWHQMLTRLQERPPYATVYGFTRLDNAVAHAFYQRQGFVLQTVSGIYDAGQAVLFSQRFSLLLEHSHAARIVS